MSRLRTAASSSALSCHGNPLHPQKDVADKAHETWCKTVLLAEIEQPICWIIERMSGAHPTGSGFVPVDVMG
jgi:hypothetical protein